MLYVTDMLLCCVCCWQHGIGLGSFNIMMNELIKALFHAKVSQDVIFFRVGTSGGLGQYLCSYFLSVNLYLHPSALYFVIIPVM